MGRMTLHQQWVEVTLNSSLLTLHRTTARSRRRRAPLHLRRTALPRDGAPPTPTVAAVSTGLVELAPTTTAARGRERGGAPPPSVTVASTVSVELTPGRRRRARVRA
jgi:hypothetical protein